MNLMVGLFGMIWTQLVVEIIMLPVSLGMYLTTLKKLKSRFYKIKGGRTL